MSQAQRAEALVSLNVHLSAEKRPKYGWQVQASLPLAVVGFGRAAELADACAAATRAVVVAWEGAGHA